MKKIIVLMFILGLSGHVFSHGEDKLGPNKGYLKMPGVFHTEVVPNADGSFNLYLLDIRFKNPTIKNSKASVQIVNGKKIIDIKCNSARDHFQCMTKKADLENGKLLVTAERNSVKGAEAAYALPLALIKPADTDLSENNNEMEDHNNH